VFTGDRGCLKSGQEISFRDVTAQMHYEVFCVDVKTDGNKRTAQGLVKLGGKSREYTCDVTESKTVADLAKNAGPVDVLVNNAGIIYCGSLLEKSEDSIIIVNVT